MPKSKHRKNHKKKVRARNERLKHQKNKMKKIQDAFFQQMLKEMEEGKFDNTEELDADNNEENNNGDIELQGSNE